LIVKRGLSIIFTGLGVGFMIFHYAILEQVYAGIKIQC